MTKGTGNPQLEDGYTQIANEILEELARFHLAPNAWRVLMHIIRKTYGYHKNVDRIANSQIVLGTGLCKAVVSRCLRTLLEQKLITKNSKKIGFQKDYTLWQKSTLSTSESPSGVEVSNIVNDKKLAVSSTELAVSSTKVSSCAVAQKKERKYEKNNIKESNGGLSPPYPLNELRKEVLKGLKIRRNYNSSKPAAEASAITWMLKHGYTGEQMLSCYDSMKKDKFWSHKALYMTKVRDEIGEFVTNKQGQVTKPDISEEEHKKAWMQA